MKIHFIGIGGIGVSALAQYFLEKGHKISGSDLASSEITEALEKRGIKIFIGQKAKNITKNLDLVIYSPAVKKDNPELKQAYKIQDTRYKIQILSYPEALGELTRQHFTIAITGTHGKSTTTAMIGLLLIKAGLDPSIIIGTKLKELGNNNYRLGKSKYLVIEACEHEESFLNYSPDIIVITNIEADHLDYYKTFDNIKRGFNKFVQKLKSGGILIKNAKCKMQISKLQCKIQNYNLKKTDAIKLRKILRVPGEHNVSNALAALAVARALKIPDKISYKVLSEYRGSWRRFEIKKIKLTNNLEPRTFTLVNDYGHHPTEVKVTLKAAREKWPKKKIWCIFQPHQYHRTYHLFNEFVKTCQNLPIDKLIITDIYSVPGRESKSIKQKVSSEKLVEAINKKNVIYLPNKDILNFLKENIQNIDVLIIMGAGDIYNLVMQIEKNNFMV